MTALDYLYTVLWLLGGVGGLLIGVKVLSDNMEKLANNKIRKLFDKSSKKKLVGVGVGTVTTAIVQSSGLTTVMVVGLVNAGIMTLYQATTVIMGANIGTTITAQIAALESFDFTNFFPLFAFGGIFADMLSKNDKIKSVGLLFAGLGLVFISLKIMSGSLSDLDADGAVTNLLSNIKNPLLLLLVGIVLTAITQSSSAITSVLITMASAGIVVGGGGNSVLYIVLGTNIGSCVTALMSSIGSSANARRAGLIHLMFNVFGSVIFFTVLLIFPSFMDVTFVAWFKGYPGTQIAMFHTAFNVICTAMFLPLTGVFVYLSEKLIKDKKTAAHEKATFLDKRLLNAPTVALEAADKEMLSALETAMASFGLALAGFEKADVSKTEEVERYVEQVTESCQDITDYLVKISAAGGIEHVEKAVSSMHHSVGDVIRVAELGQNITKYTRRRVKYELDFSASVVGELEKMKEKLFEMHGIVNELLSTKDQKLLVQADEIENEVDTMRTQLMNDHIERLNNGECKAESSSVFVNLVNNLERIGDHLNYIAHSFE